MNFRKYSKILGAFIVFLSQAIAAPFNVHLSWQDNRTATSMVLTWNTTDQTASQVRYGLTEEYGESFTGKTHLGFMFGPGGDFQA